MASKTTVNSFGYFLESLQRAQARSMADAEAARGQDPQLKILSAIAERGGAATLLDLIRATHLPLSEFHSAVMAMKEFGLVRTGDGTPSPLEITDTGLRALEAYDGAPNA